MKHLFLIHSHTTFLTSLGILNQISLKPEDVAIVYIRNYRNDIIPMPYKSLDLSWAFMYPSIKKFFRFNHFIKKVDGLMDELVASDKYIMYASFPGNVRLYQVIYSNFKCVGFNYIQEGALIFKKVFEKDKLPLKYRAFDLLLRAFTNNRMWCSHNKWTVPPFNASKLYRQPECFALDKNFFKYTGYITNEIEWPSFDIVKSDYAINPQIPCFIFESSVEMGVIEDDIYMECVEELIRRKGEKSNYVKFHPYQSEFNKKRIMEMYKKGDYEVEELPMNVPFELYLSSYKGMKVYGFMSSLVVFAEQLGHITYSMENDLLKKSAKYRSFRNSL